jgi:MbtH protein
MSGSEREEATVFRVVVNHEEQYSIWPADRPAPGGWREIEKTGSREECLDHIARVWTDLRPRSARPEHELK